MGMSTHICGFKPPDAKWKAMKAVWDSCRAAGIDAPKEVEDFFGGEVPDPKGVEVELGRDQGLREWGTDYADGFELDVKKLPPDVTVIRFYNHY
jgi:hypothetical protein